MSTPVSIIDYATGTTYGTAHVNMSAYDAHLASDTSHTGAVLAKDWLTEDQMSWLDIDDGETTVYFE